MYRESVLNQLATFISVFIIIAFVDQTTSESSHNYMENMLEVLDTGKAMSPCCRCPADGRNENPEEIAEAPHETDPVNVVDSVSLVEQYSSLVQKRYVAPKLDIPNIYRMGFFWKSRMCCDCDVDDDTVKMEERRKNLNLV